jgi:hypothetical protein
MDMQRLAAVLLIADFAAVMLSSMVNAPGLYATQDIDKRLEILKIYRTRWLMERALAVLSALLMIVGFCLLASTLQTTGSAWIPVLGAGAIVVGTIVGMHFVYCQTVDPRGGYSGAYRTAENVAYWLWLAGTLLFGVTFLQADLPAWLGYLAAGAAIVYGIVFLFTRVGFMTPFLVGLLSLVIGIVLLGQ